MLEQFNKQYKYKSDSEKYGTSLDVWEVISSSSQGVYEGDCESYCRTLKSINKQFKDWDYYYCKLDGIGHCILVKNGDVGEVIDCNTQSIVTFENYCKIYKVTGFKKYNWFVVFSKILFSNMYLFYRKLRGI